MRPADGCVIDLDGTVYVGDVAVDGAAAAVATLRRAGVPFCFATNTTRRPRSALMERLASMGIETDATALFTAPVAAADWLAHEGFERLSLLLPEETFEEFSAFEIGDHRPEAVVVGDLASDWTYDRLNAAFNAIRNGAKLIAIHKNPSWDPGNGLVLDAGAFVSALEYATGQRAVLVGKPSTPFFHTAARTLGVALERVAVVGDSVANDVVGGHEAGCLGVAVRTGTFQESDLTGLDRGPDAVLDTIADLPRWLDL